MKKGTQGVQGVEDLLLASGYQPRGLLGTGGMARVIEVIRESDGRTFAAKILGGGSATLSEPEGLARFKREFANLKRIRHPGVVRAIDFIHTAGRPPIIVMELVAGTPLRQCLDSPMPWRRATWIAIDVLDALQAVHAVDLVHRDVTPGNIMLVHNDSERPRACIIDFGISFDESAPLITQTGKLLGTPHFIAPERTYASGRFDHRADIYSVGALLYNMLTGTPPFSNLNQHALLAAHQHTPIAPLPGDLGVPEALAVIIHIAMAKSPDARFPTAGLMWRALQASLTAPPEGQSASVRRTRKLSLSAAPDTPGYRPGRITPEAGRRYIRLLKDAEGSLRQYAWPEWATEEQRDSTLKAVSTRGLPLRTRRLGQPIEVDWMCAGCGGVRQLSLLALGHLEYCEYCGGRQPTAVFRPLREPLSPLSEGLFDPTSGDKRWQQSDFTLELRAGEQEPLAVAGREGCSLFVPDHGVSALRLRLAHHNGVALFKPLIRVERADTRLDIESGASVWLKPEEVQEISLGSIDPTELPLDVVVGIGGPEHADILCRLQLRANPTPQHVAISIGESRGTTGDRFVFQPGDPIAVKFVSDTPLPDITCESTFQFGTGEDAIVIALTPTSSGGPVCRWDGQLPHTIPGFQNGPGRLALRFGVCLEPVEFDVLLESSEPDQGLDPTALIETSRIAHERPSALGAEPTTTGVTGNALRISGLRIPVETVLKDGGLEWTVPTLVAGLRCRHELLIQNTGEGAVVLRGGRCVQPHDRAPVPWLELESSTDGWPLVLGREQEVELHLWVTPPPDSARSEPLVVQLEFDVEGATRPDAVLMLIARIHRQRIHPAPLIIDMGTSAIRFFTQHRGRLRALACDISGSPVESSYEIPAVCQILKARATAEYLAPAGHAGRAALEDMLTRDAGLHVDVRTGFESTSGGVGGPLDTKPIFLETPEGARPYVARGSDLIDILLRAGWRAVCERYRLVIKSIVLVHPSGYNHLHLARLFGLLNGFAPDVDLHLGPGDATAWALARPSEENELIVLDVGRRTTRITHFRRDDGRWALGRAKGIELGGQKFGDALLRQVFESESASPAQSTSIPPWRHRTRDGGSLFVEPGPNSGPPQFHGPLPPWLARLSGEAHSPQRHLRPVLEAPATARGEAALEILRAACQRAAAEPGWADAPGRSEALAPFIPLVDWVDRDGVSVRPTAGDCARITRQISRSRLLNGPLLDELIGDVRDVTADIDPTAPILLAGRGHHGSVLAERLGAETGRRVELREPMDIARGADRWLRDPRRVDDAPPDVLEFSVCTLDGTLMIPSGTPVRAAVAYRPITTGSVHLRCTDGDVGLAEMSAALDLRSLVRRGGVRPDEQGFAFPRIALKIWVEPRHAEGRSELRMQPVELEHWTAERLEEALKQHRERAPRMPRVADRFEGNQPLRQWIEGNSVLMLEGEVELGDAQTLGTCPVVTHRL